MSVTQLTVLWLVVACTAATPLLFQGRTKYDKVVEDNGGVFKEDASKRNVGDASKMTADAQDDGIGLDIQISTDGNFTISVNKVPWLRSGGAFFRSGGEVFSSYTNLLLKSTSTGRGTDSIGDFQITSFTYQAGQASVGASIKIYPKYPLLLFSQYYSNGANGTKAGDVNDVISGFPTFLVNGTQTSAGPLGYMAYGGGMMGDEAKAFGLFSADDFRITDGITGGPLALFDGSGDTLVISPASQFMAASSKVMTQQTETGNGFGSQGDRLAYGVMGGVDVVPSDYTVDFIVYYSPDGINQAFEGWGAVLRPIYGRSDVVVKQDLTINYLGYWTDNGAYYYYKSEDNKTYQDTIIDVTKNADQLNIPYRYMQYDSWWYYKGVGDGVKTWVSRPDIFPDSFQYVYNQTGLPVSAHNRYWSSDTTYAKQNGGQYNFIVEKEKAVPNDQKFWDDLMSNSTKAWGLYTYEQDWLNVEFAQVEALLTDIELGAMWLNQMAQGASKSNVTIQYCMSNPRHILQALPNNAVTQSRASNDYHPGTEQWKIGITSIFARAVRIAPFKDNFWTTPVQPGNPKYGNATEPNNMLQTAVSVLSTGPVGPSDMIGHTNVSLVMRCCNADGLILKPSKPATAVDDQIYKLAFGSTFSGPEGEVWTTYSTVSGLYFGIVFVPEISGKYYLTPAKAGFNMFSEPTKVFDPRNPKASLTNFGDDAPLYVSSCDVTAPCIYYVTPVLRGILQTVILGELDKLVPVSPQRFTKIQVGGDVTLWVRGSPGETSRVSFIVLGELITVTCNFPASGNQIISLNYRSCFGH